MHTNEFYIDQKLVSKLIAEQFPEWSNLPLTQVLSSGTDNTLFRLGNDKLVRLPRIDWAVENVEKEYEYLLHLAPFLPCSIPTPLKKGKPTKDYPWPWSIYSWIEGNNPQVGQVSEALLYDLINFLKALHHITIPNGPLCNRGVPLKQKDKETRIAIHQLGGMIDTPKVLSIWEKSLNIPQWSKPPVWMHGDLSAGNLLIKNDRLCGVIDFGNLGIGDPAADLLIAWNFLPVSMRNIFRSELNIDEETWERGKGWALSVALIQLPYYKDTNPMLANSARHVIQELIQDDKNQFELHFKPAKSDQKKMLHKWFEQKHILEWMHGVGLKNTLEGLEKFFQGQTAHDWTYWIGYNKDIPFAFLITSPEGEDAITLDFFICDLNYLGKGLAIPTIKTFLTTHFSHKKRVLIDPEATNKRAIHVYEKVGFKITHEFIASWHPVPHYQMELNMEDLLSKSTV